MVWPWAKASGVKRGEVDRLEAEIAVEQLGHEFRLEPEVEELELVQSRRQAVRDAGRHLAAVQGQTTQA